MWTRGCTDYSTSVLCHDAFILTSTSRWSYRGRNRIINPHLRSVSKQLKIQTNSYSECAPQNMCDFITGCWKLNVRMHVSNSLLYRWVNLRSNLMRCCTVTHTHWLQTVARTIHHAQITRTESFSVEMHGRHCSVISQGNSLETEKFKHIFLNN